jgi:hypothetical protein
LEFGELLVARRRMMMKNPFDTPPKSLKYSNANLKEKTVEEYEIGVNYLTRSTLGVKRAC